MKKGWVEVRLKEVTKIIGGYAFKSTDFIPNEGIPVIKIKSLKDRNLVIDNGDFISDTFLSLNEKYHIKYNDILIALTGSHITLPSSAVGRVAKSRHRKTLLLNQRVGKFQVDPNVCDDDFLYYFLVTDYFFECVGLKSKGAANQANISAGDIGEIKINLPPLPTQRKIAAILSAYDDLIENNLKRIKLLEEKAQLTYEEWFVRMKFPGHESTPINEETGLPEGWEEKALGEVIEITSSKRIFLADYVEEGIPFYRGKEIILKSKNEALNERLFISNKRFNEIKEKFGAPKKGDLLITAVGTLGFPYLVTESDGDFYFKDGNLIWFKGNKEISSTYLISCFKNDQFKLNLYNIAIGSSQKALTIQSLKGLKIINPKKDISSTFDSLIAPILDAIESLQNQNQLLKEARDILLPRLMTGMIDVDALDLSAFGIEEREEMLMAAEPEADYSSKKKNDEEISQN